MSRPRWWQRGGRSVEDEEFWFTEAGLEFELDRELLKESEVVVFRGDLRLDDRRSPAVVVYPPAYGAGEQPVVIAPELNIGRHRSPDGTLCLDHVVLGEASEMCGAEAVERAERLWLLWETDRDQLGREEADAPDPWANYVQYTPGSAMTFADVDVAGGNQGYLNLGLTSLVPFRGGVTQLRLTHPAASALELAAANRPFVGPYEVAGRWKRLGAPPPDPRLHGIGDWLQSEHRAFTQKAFDFARKHTDRNMPALVAFVYPDEGPGRGETHDAWLFVAIRPDGSVELPRPFHLRSEERWLRQPHLRPLGEKSVAVVGVGAIGSQVVDLLARAGVGRLVLVDYDIVTPGNRIRHELDLRDVGQSKVGALARRLRLVNPWCEVIPHDQRFGGAQGPDLAGIQARDDELAELLGGCHLIVNCSAHHTTSIHLSSVGRETKTPVIHAWVSAGAWGARILRQRQRPRRSGCWECVGHTQQDALVSADGGVPKVSDDPAVEVVMERGCADPTFTGPGFELTATATAAARLCVQTLVGRGSYPSADYDLATLDFRSAKNGRPGATYSDLAVHPDCSICSRG